MDHKKLSCANFTSSRIMRWRFIIDEYRLIIEYIKGDDSTAIDVLSGLPMTDEQALLSNLLAYYHSSCYTWYDAHVRGDAC